MLVKDHVAAPNKVEGCFEAKLFLGLNQQVGTKREIGIGGVLSDRERHNPYE
jgi:hypothetical protein